MAAESATHIFASLHTFSDAAKNEVVDQFLALDGGRNADVQHTPDNRFVIRCAKGDMAPFLFLDHMKKYIDSNVGKVPETFESVKVNRAPETEIETTLDFANLVSSKDFKEEFSTPDKEEDAVVEKALIPHEIFIRSWKSAFIKEISDVTLRFPESVLKEIGALTSCRVELKPDEGTITARAENMQDVEQAILKLNLIDSWMNLRSTFPFSYEFCYVEGELDIMLQMIPLKDLPDRRLQTTLTPPNLPPVKSLGSYLAVAMLKNGTIVSTIQNGRPLSSINLKESQLWKSHRFGPRGDENTPALQQLGNPIQSENKALDHWLQISNSARFEDPFSPSNVPQAPPIPIAKPSPEPEIQAPPVRKRHVRIRKPMGLEATGIDVAKSLMPHVAHQKSSPPAPSSPTVPNGGHVDAGPLDTDLMAFEEDLIKTTVTPPIAANHHATADNDVLKIDKSSFALLADIHNQVDQGPTMNIAAEDEKLAPYRAPPPIRAPFMPAEQQPSSNPDESVSDPTWTEQIVGSTPATRLIDFTSSHGQCHERVQNEGEIDTRLMKRTMKQKKPAALVGSSNAMFALYRNIELAMTEVLKLAQRAQGPLLLCMEIGRVLITPPSNSSEIKRKPFAFSDWSSVFPGGRKLETFFTKVLTTLPMDAEFILDIKLSCSRKMFVHEAARRRVTYSFDCRTRSNNHVIIEVEENGTFKVWCDPTLVGVSNWHFPKRSWDARMALTCFEHVSEEIHAAAQDLVNNLRIKPAADRKTVEISVKSSGGSLRDLSGCLRREASYESSDYSDILVNLCEVQDLKLWQPNGPQGSFEGSVVSPNAAVDAGRLWWEVTVSSVEVETRLKANDHRELGSGADWEPANILAGDSMSHLCHTTRELVTRMDSVGCYNKGSQGGSGTRTSDRDKKPEEKFW